MSAFRRLAIYCGSASPADGRYLDLAAAVGRELAGQAIGIVYGGGRRGLMGAMADAALAAGGEVIGVIPEALKHAELAHPGLATLEIVPDMHTRKARFTDLSDGFVTLPGGVGTMDELWEAMSWAQLGYHAKPVGLLNAFGFYDALLAFNRQMISVGFIRPAHAGLLIHADTLGGLLDAMASAVPHRPLLQMGRDDL